tara:strand:+ start:1792 stop:2433 length:642 start_codon:yes stop_codon:yes gene_type:complete
MENKLWWDLRLSEATMNYLWKRINYPTLSSNDARKKLAGNISRSNWIQDEDDWFYENVLKELAEKMFLIDPVVESHLIVKEKIPEFKLKTLWVNYQKQYEFNPPHNHKALFSFVVFMKIPTHWKEQHALPISVSSNIPLASTFSFILGKEQGRVQNIPVHLCPEDEGRMLFFPAWLMHEVFPFYGTEEERITVSGNIIFDSENFYDKTFYHKE